MVFFHLVFLQCTTIRPKIRVLNDLFLLFAHDHSTKIYGLLLVILSFVHDHSTKNQIPHSFISFMCTRPFDQKYGPLFIYSFFYARPFDQDLGSSLIYFFYLHTTIRPNYLVLFHLFILSRMTIRLKIRVLINLFILFVHDHSTKVRGHSSFLTYSFIHCADIFFAIFKAVISLYFVRSISGSTAFIFRLVYSQQYYPYVSYTIFMEVLLLYFVRYIHSYMKSQPSPS